MNTSKIPFHELFQASHDEQLLKPVKDLVQQVRAAGIEVYALDKFAAPHVAALGRNGSSAVFSADGSESPRGIVLNITQSNAIANEAGVTDKIEAFRTCLAHEWGHCDAHQRGREFDSEVLAWDFARKHSKLSAQDFDNLRRVCFLRESPQLTPDADIDNRPEFLKAFDQHCGAIGYDLAWGMASQMARLAGLQDWQILNALTDCNWDFDSAYELTHGDVKAGLVRRAVVTCDYKELERLTKLTMPKQSARHIPEQPIV